MDKIMTVSLVFEHKEHGTILVGVNPELDSLPHPEIKLKIGDRIMITGEGHPITCEVQSIQISTSLANKKNIGISIGEHTAAKDIQVGSVVYALT